MRRRAVTGNAADPHQVRYAERKAKRQEEVFLGSLRQTMSTAEGRLVMWELLERAGIYRSIWDPSAKIHYNAGRQDFGHELLVLLLEAGEDFYLLMETEARRRDRADAREAAAVQTPAAAEAQTDGE